MFKAFVKLKDKNEGHTIFNVQRIRKTVSVVCLNRKIKSDAFIKIERKAKWLVKRIRQL